MTGIAVVLIVAGTLVCCVSTAWWQTLLGSLLAVLGAFWIEAVVERLFHSIWRLQEHLGLEDDYEFRHK